MAREPTARHQPQPDWTFDDSPAHHAAQRRLATLVGIVALALPPLLAVADPPCFRQSLSSYYFSAVAGDLFVAGLAVIATCLVAFAGESRGEARLTTLAAFAAIGVALVPTDQPGCPLAAGYAGRFAADLVLVGDRVVIDPNRAAADWIGAYRPLALVHHLCALALLLFLAHLCLRVFTRVVPARHLRPDGRPWPSKRRRDRLYRLSGAVILACIALMVAGQVVRSRAAPLESWWDAWNLTFWVESAALWAFGLAWMVKGRALGPAFRDPLDPTS